MIKAVLATLLLGACAAAPGSGVHTGHVVEAPAGFTELCERESSAPECGK